MAKDDLSGADIKVSIGDTYNYPVLLLSGVLHDAFKFGTFTFHPALKSKAR